MRFLRKLIGLGMIMVAVPALLVGGAGWIAGGHRDPNGAFTADLAPVHSSGPVVVVPDVADVLGRHRVGGMLTPGRVRVTVASSQSPVLLVVMSADAARRYLDGVARTEVAAVGYAAGPQPVTTQDIAGTDTLARLPAAGVLTSGTDVVFDPSAQPGRLSLLIVRDDLTSGVAASLVVGIRPGWFEPASRGLLLGGGLLLVGGLAVLLWRSAREVTLVVEAERVADLVAEKMPRFAPHSDELAGFTPLREPREVWALPSSQDPTGEPGSVHTFEVDELQSAWGTIDGVEDEMSDMVERDEQSKDGIARRFGNLLRRRSGGRHIAPSTVEQSSEDKPVSPRDRFQGESPYIYTAT
jgi:hypothetical protein